MSLTDMQAHTNALHTQNPQTPSPKPHPCGSSLRMDGGEDSSISRWKAKGERRPISHFSPKVFVTLDFHSGGAERVESELQSKDVVFFFYGV